MRVEEGTLTLCKSHRVTKEEYVPGIHAVSFSSIVFHLNGLFYNAFLAALNGSFT